MSWNTLHEGRTRKPFTNVLIEDSRTTWSWHQDAESGQEFLTWQDYEQEITTFSQVAEIIWHTKYVDDDTYRAQVIPQVKEVMKNSPLFRQLDDPNIQVTKGHQKLRPARHVTNVALCVTTDGDQVTDNQRFLLRLGSWYHDHGKGLSAGIPENEILPLMERYQNLQHSFPNHDLISVLILESLTQAPEVQALITMMGPKNWEILLLMIHNHHVFEFKSGKDGSDPVAQLKEQMPSIVSDPAALEAFLLTFILAFADLNSTVAYREFWPEKLPQLQSLFESFTEQLPLFYFASTGLHAHALGNIILETNSESD